MTTDKIPSLHYFILNKPFGVLSQFTSEAGHKTLRDFGPFPRDVYPAGRLDTDSEGLILLTNDNHIKHRLLSPAFAHSRTYLAQVERIPPPESLQLLREGVVIEGKKTLPALVRLLDGDPPLPPRPVPIRFRKDIPTAWIELTIHEGRNRQVRKMTAAVGFPTLRLVRIAMENLTINGLEPGQSRAVNEEELRELQRRVMPHA